MKRKTIIELSKSILILLLSCSAALLSWKTGLFSDVLAKRPAETAVEESAFIMGAHTAAAYPKAAVVTWKSGMRFGISYDSEVMKKLLSSFSVLLEEAYGTISNVQSITEAEWRSRLNEMGVYFEYGGYFMPSVLASWVGTGTRLSDEYPIRRLSLSPGENGTVLLSFESGENTYYSCDTFTQEQSLEEAVQKWLPNGAEFAYQVASLNRCSPYLLISDSELFAFTMEKREADWEAVVTEMADIIGLKQDSAGSYEEQGEQVYLCTGGQLRLVKNKRIIYSVDGAESPIKAVELPDKVEAARQLIHRLASACGGAAETELLSCISGENSTELSFFYQMDGIRIADTENEFSKVRFQGNELTEICFFPKSYEKAEEAEGLLPELQAAAAAGSISEGAVPELIFLDNGAATLVPVWVVKNGET